ncbi:MAG: aminopeptidase [Candidatus Woesearchaeota archaeon]
MIKKSKILANTLLTYSLTIQPNETIFIYGEDIHDWFVKLLNERICELGGNSIVYLFNLNKRKKMIEENILANLKKEQKHILKLMKKSNSMIEIISLSNPIYLNNVNPKKITDYNNIIVNNIIKYRLGNGFDTEGMKWVLTEVPCIGQANLTKMTNEKYSNYLYKSTNQDWINENKRMQKIKELFDYGKNVRILVSGLTDFSFSLKNRGGYIEDGHINMPGGEIFYGPVEDSANGYITFNTPIIRNAAVIKNIKLTFKEGKIIKYSAKTNQKLLESLIKIKGANKLGEFAVGTNGKIKKFAKNISFDEKINGTIHIALGNSYPYLLSNGGGLNKSKLHWDIVCDLRKKGKNPGGKIFVDDKLVQENGIWVFNITNEEKQFIPKNHKVFEN